MGRKVKRRTYAWKQYKSSKRDEDADKAKRAQRRAEFFEQNQWAVDGRTRRVEKTEGLRNGTWYR